MPRIRYAQHRPTQADHSLLSQPSSEMGIVRQAEALLRDRIDVRRGHRLLDGSPCDLDRLMREANVLLASHGMDQLGRNPAWHA